MRNAGILVLSFLLSLQSLAQYPGFSYLPQPDAFRTAFEAASARTNSIQSRFVQEKNLSMLDEKMISRGRFWFKKENRVRMEYEQPFQYLMVINQNQVYVRDGSKENRISTRSNRIFGEINRIIIGCVQGTALSNPDFSYRVFEAPTEYLVELNPLAKSMKELFNSIIVRVAKSDYSVARIELHEQNGDLTVIRLTEKELNIEIPDSLFAVH